MILWWGKKKQPDPKTGETPIEPLKPDDTPASPLAAPAAKPVATLDEQIFGNAPIPQAEPELDDDPIGLRKAAERIAAERAAEAAAREASVLHKLSEGLKRSSSRQVMVLRVVVSRPNTPSRPPCLRSMAAICGSNGRARRRGCAR